MLPLEERRLLKRGWPAVLVTSIAIFLIVTGCLKVVPLILAPIGDILHLNNSFYLVGGLVEIGFAFWWLSGKGTRVCWAASLILFMLLGCLSFLMWIGGEVSCGCFGNLRSPPWLSFAIDVGVIVGLLTFGRLTARSSTTVVETRSPFFVSSLIGVVIAIPLSALLLSNTIASPWILGGVSAMPSHHRVLLDPFSPVDERIPIQVTNYGSRSVSLVGYTVVGCTPFTVEGLPVAIGPHDRQTVFLRAVAPLPPSKLLNQLEESIREGNLPVPEAATFELISTLPNRGPVVIRLEQILDVRALDVSMDSQGS